jgi:hypothetical protein
VVRALASNAALPPSCAVVLWEPIVSLTQPACRLPAPM